MKEIINKPTFTTIIDDVSQFSPEPQSIYITTMGTEERSLHFKEWTKKPQEFSFLTIIDHPDSQNRVSIKLKNELIELNLRSMKSLDFFIQKIGAGRKLYLDITGLTPTIMGPIVKSAIFNKANLEILYIEPSGYRQSPSPTMGEIFDLSKKIRGISPIPGFASFLDYPENKTIFIPILGFEGPRFSFMLEDAQPNIKNIYPIIGVPGFKIQYPFYAYEGNKQPLTETKSWQRISYARANCPFSLLYKIEDFLEKFQDHLIKVAPIGTMPHALGALLAYIFHPNRIEIMYDHPERNPLRTAGTDKVCIFNIYQYLNSNNFNTMEIRKKHL